MCWPRWWYVARLTQVPAGTKNVRVNSVIAIMAEEGDDLSGADAMAEEAKNESGAGSSGGDKAEKSDDKKSDDKKSDGKSDKKDDGKKSGGSESQPSGSSAPSAKERAGKHGDKFSREQETFVDTDAAKREPKSNAGARSSDKPLDRVFATPVARRLAMERGVPLLEVKGSGPDGRIVKEDVEKYQSGGGGGGAPASAAAAPAGAAAYTDTPVSNMRRVIAQRLSESKATVPHYYVTFDIELDRVLQLREVFNRASEEAAKGDAAKAKASKLSVNDFIVKAAAIALRQVPAVNSAWHGEFIREHHTQDISMAVSTPTGLITPILRNCGALGLAEIGSQSKALAKKARDGKLKPEEYQGGSFTISNMGMMGTSHFTAIINPPQSCILALGKTQPRLVPDASSERGFKTVQIMQATISADHRVVDGATAAQWMQAFQAALENPLSFML